MYLFLPVILLRNETKLPSYSPYGILCYSIKTTVYEFEKHCAEAKQLHYEFCLQEQRLIELLTHAIPRHNILKFSSVNLVRQLYLTIMVFIIYCKILYHR